MFQSRFLHLIKVTFSLFGLFKCLRISRDTHWQFSSKKKIKEQVKQLRVSRNQSNDQCISFAPVVLITMSFSLKRNQIS